MLYVVKNMFNSKYIKFNRDNFEEVRDRNNATLTEGPIYGIRNLQNLCNYFKLNLKEYKIVGFVGDFE